MTGGSSTLPPVYFTEGVETEFTVKFTLEQWTDVISALYTGADLSYPDRAHEVIWHLLKQVEYPNMPVRRGSYALIPGYGWTATFGAALTVATSTGQYLNVLAQQTPPVQLDTVVSEYYALEAGRYRWRYIYNRSPSGGLASFLARRELGTTALFDIPVDQYNAVTQLNRIATGTFVLDTSENWSFEKTIASKNPSSTGYQSQFVALEIWREDV